MNTIKKRLKTSAFTSFNDLNMPELYDEGKAIVKDTLEKNMEKLTEYYHENAWKEINNYLLKQNKDYDLSIYINKSTKDVPEEFVEEIRKEYLNYIRKSIEYLIHSTLTKF